MGKRTTKGFNKQHLIWIIPSVLVVVCLLVFFLSDGDESEDIVRECSLGDIKNRHCEDRTAVFDECQEKVGGFFYVERQENCDIWHECNQGICVDAVTPSGFRNGDDCSDASDLFHQKYSSNSSCLGDANFACGVQCDGAYGVGCSFTEDEGTVFVEVGRCG